MQHHKYLTAVALGKAQEKEAGSHLALDFPGVLVVDGAADADAGAQDFLDCACQLARAAAVAHDARDLDHLVQLQVAAVLDVLLLHARNNNTRSAHALAGCKTHGTVCQTSGL